MEIHGIVVAKSRKNNGYCVVIYDIDGERFVRLVSNEDRKGGELIQSECEYEDGQEISLKDEIIVNILEEKPNNLIQPENCYLNANKKIKFISKLCTSKMKDIIGPLINKADIIYYNRGYAVPERESFAESFVICEVENLCFKELIKTNPFDSWQPPKSKLACFFSYKGNKYGGISCTMEKSKEEGMKKYLNKEYSKALVAFSIGEVYYGYHYKFLCSVFETNEGEIE